MRNWKTCFHRLLAVMFLTGWALTGQAQQIRTYFTMDEMPDLVKCLPAPPDTLSAAFTYDIMRYMWGKTQRLDPVRAAQADRDAVWDLGVLFESFSEAFGHKLSPEGTPQIWKLLEESISTIEQIRVRPKAHYHRLRPFERFNEHLLTVWEEPTQAGEGSYPSGHTIRGWSMALVLSELNPARAEAICERGWIYCENRVIVGAHWQSDVDASRVAASIGYAKIQTRPAYRHQMELAREELAKL